MSVSASQTSSWHPSWDASCRAKQLLAEADVVLLPKPQPEDLAELRDGQVLWGWPHCVQDRAITQLAIDKKLTLIAFEAMNHWASDGGFGLHVFHKNNELAGYCSVLHALALTGSTGDYGRRLSAVVIGFGATARGAVTALNAHGIHDVQVLTNRGVAAVGSPIHSVRIAQFDHDSEAPFLSEVITERGRVPLAPFLAESDIVVNCTLQDPNAPLTYLRTEDLAAFRPGSLIVDVSCDEGMGFSWAKTTTFADPMFTVGDHIDYYAVDHSPSYLWNSSSWEISEALLPFLADRGRGTRGLGRERDHPPRDRNPRRRGPEPGCAAVPAAAAGVPARPAGRLGTPAPYGTHGVAAACRPPGRPLAKPVGGPLVGPPGFGTIRTRRRRSFRSTRSIS